MTFKFTGTLPGLSASATGTGTSGGGIPREVTTHCGTTNKMFAGTAFFYRSLQAIYAVNHDCTGTVTPTLTTSSHDPADDPLNNEQHDGSIRDLQAELVENSATAPRRAQRDLPPSD